MAFICFMILNIFFIIQSRDVRTVVKTPGIWWSDPHGLEQTRWARFSVDKKNHLVSMLAMLGPSPDWCVGKLIPAGLTQKSSSFVIS